MSTSKENNTVVRLSKAIVYIEKNLDKRLSLHEVAAEACFSPYHFHRLFSIVIGETLNNFIVRKRIERAADFLLHKPQKQITQIAEEVGFASLSSFSRAFKKFYGLSPMEFKEQSPSKFSKISKTKSKNGKVEVLFEQYICNINNALKWIDMKAQTQVKIIEEINVAYVGHQGKMEAMDTAFNKLMQWGFPKGLMNQPNLRMATIYHDSPKITDPDKIRMSACMIVPNKIQTEGEVGFRVIPKTKCIVANYEIKITEFQQAWESTFVWMNEHGYKRAIIDPFEIYYNNPKENPEKCIVDICIPIE